MGSKISKDVISSQYKIINLTSFNNELSSASTYVSSIDIVLLSRLMNKISVITYHNIGLYDVVTMRWKNKKITIISRNNISLSNVLSTSSNEELRSLSNDGTLLIHLLNRLPYHVATSMPSICINEDDSIVISGINCVSIIKKRHRDELDVIWYSGIKNLRYHGNELKTRIDYMIVNGDVITFNHHLECSVIMINIRNSNYQYYIEPKMLTTPYDDDNLIDNVRQALNRIIEDCYSS